MDIKLNANKNNILAMYVEILNPILRLKRREKELLTSILKVYADNISYGEAYVFKLLNSTATKKELRAETSFSEPSFNNHLKQLRDKGVLVDGMILPLIAKNIPIGKDELIINYNVLIDGIGQETKEDNQENS